MNEANQTKERKTSTLPQPQPDRKTAVNARLKEGGGGGGETIGLSEAIRSLERRVRQPIKDSHQVRFHLQRQKGSAPVPRDRGGTGAGVKAKESDAYKGWRGTISNERSHRGAVYAACARKSGHEAGLRRHSKDACRRTRA